MKTRKRCPTEIVAPAISLLVFVLFTVWVHIPADGAEKAFDPEGLPGESAYYDIVSVAEPSPIGGETLLCRSTDTKGKVIWFTMSYDQYYGAFQELFSVTDGTYFNGQFVYGSEGTVRLHGYVICADRNLQQITGKTILELRNMELRPE